MLKSRKKPTGGPDKRAETGMPGVAKILGVDRATVYRRIERKTFSLEGVRARVTGRGHRYDLHGVFQRVYPDADDNTITMMMYDFRQKHGRLTR